MNSEEFKDKHKKHRDRKLKDKEKRTNPVIKREKEPYIRKAPRDLVDDFYIGRLTNEDS